MKKAYMKPLMEVMKLDALNIVCASSGISDSPAINPGKAPLREVEDFDFLPEPLLW